MSTGVVERPTGGELFVASALAMLVSIATMGALIALAAWLGEGAPGVLAGVGLVLWGAMMGLVGALPGAPVAVLIGTLLFLQFGCALLSKEASTGVYKRVHWLALGAAMGVIVATVMIVEQAVFAGTLFTGFAYHRLLYAPAMVAGMIGMLVWHAVIFAITRRVPRA